MAGSIKGLTLQIGGDTTKLTQALKEPASQTKDLKSKLSDVNKALKFDTNNVGLLDQKQRLLKDTISSTEKELETLKEAQAQYIASGKDIDGAEYIALEAKIATVSKSLENLKSQQTNFNGTVEALGNKLGDFGEKATKTGKTLTKSVTAPIVGLGTVAVTTAANFESSMSQVQATMGITKEATSELNGESVNTMDALNDLAQEMGANTAFSAKEAADAINYLALAGYDTQQMYETLPTVLNLAAAGGMDLATASDMVTDAMSALGDSAGTAEEFVDKMAKTASSSNTSVSQLGDAILTVGGTAKNLAGGTTELNTALGILADNGIKGAEGGTTLRNMILSLSAPTNKAAGLMEALGLKVFDAEGNMRPLNDTFADLNTILSTMNQEERTNVLSTIFNKVDLKGANALLANTVNGFSGTNDALKNCGVEWSKYSDKVWAANGEVEGVVTDMVYNLGILGTSAEELQEYLMFEYDIEADDALKMIQAVTDSVDDQGSRWEELSGLIDDSANAAGDMADTQLDNLEGQLTLLKSALEGLSIAFGKILLPYIKQGVQWIQNVVDKLNSMDEKTKKIIVGVGALAAASGPLLIGIGKASTGAAALIKHFNSVNTVGGKIIQTLAGLTGSSGTAVLALGGIAAGAVALGAAFVNLWQNNEDFRNKMIEIWDQIKSRIDEFCQGIVDRINNLGFNFTDITQVLGAVWQGFCDLLAPVFEGVWQQISNIIDYALDLLTGLFDVISGIFTGDWELVWQGVQEIFKGAWDFCISTFETSWNTIKGVFDQLFSWLGPEWESCWNSVKDFLDQTFGQIMDVLHAAWDFVQALFSGNADQINQTWETLWNAVKTLCDSVWEGIKSALSVVWDAIKNLAASAWDALKSTISSGWDAIKSGTEQAWNNIKAWISGIWDNVKSKCSEVWNGLIQAVANGWNNITATTQTLWNNIISYLNMIWDGLKQKCSEIWEGIESSISNVLEGIKSTCSSVWEGIQSTITGVWEGLKSTASSVWEGIKEAIRSPIETAKDIVYNAIESIKSFFNFQISWPHIPLPHFTISGSLNPLDWLDGGLPNIGVEFYAKAMDAGKILKNATVFGMQNGKLLAGGEAGEEVVVGTASLRQMIDQSVNKALIDTLESVRHSSTTQIIETESEPFDYARIEKKLDQVTTAISRMQVVIDKTKAGKILAPVIDKELGGAF